MRPIALALLLLAGGTQDEARDSVTARELEAHVHKLCGIERRWSAHPGEERAARYAADAFKAAGLAPAGEKGGWFQTFTVAPDDTGWNVLGRWEGSDEKLKHEMIAIGAHIDAYGGPGADDNASGVAAVLEVADAMRRLKVRPRRSILFCGWGTEETGLHGSKHFVANPTVPLERIAVYVNLDRVGRNDREKKFVWVAGAESAEPSLRPILEKLKANDGLEARLEEPGMAALSDCRSFYDGGRPIVNLYTLDWGRIHPDYHRPSDSAEKLHYPSLEKVARLALDAVLALAALDKAPSRAPGFLFPHPGGDRPKRRP